MKFLSQLRRIHSDERGLEAIQVVLIMAIAAVVLLVVKANWDVIRDWFSALYDELMK